MSNEPKFIKAFPPDVKMPIREENLIPPPKKSWWKKTLDSLGNAIGESLFGGDR